MLNIPIALSEEILLRKSPCQQIKDQTIIYRDHHMHEAATAHEQSERIKYIIMLNYAYRLDKDMDQS